MVSNTVEYHIDLQEGISIWEVVRGETMATLTTTIEVVAIHLVVSLCEEHVLFIQRVIINTRALMGHVHYRYEKGVHAQRWF